MYAVIKTGGKQYRVSEGDVIRVEKLDAETGQTVDFDQILMTKQDNDEVDIGTPYLESRKVVGEVLAQDRAKKIEVVKFIRRKRHLTRRGHRQSYTEIRITQIT